MRILAFSDLHRNRAVAERIAAEAGRADLVIGAGDFATHGEGLADTASLLLKVEPPMVIVAGNHDHIDELRSAFGHRANVHLLHAEAVSVGHVNILGLGFEIGEVPGALPESIMSEQAADHVLERFGSADILVTHAPPYGAGDIQRDHTHQGSRAIRNWIEKARPRLSLCGHIHHAWGTTGMIGATPVHNLGPTLNWFQL
jgi:uncharacterized protein